MRIRKFWNNNKNDDDDVHSHDFSVTPLAPSTPPPLPLFDLVSSTAQSHPPWLQIWQGSQPIRISRINVSICSNQNPVVTGVAEEEGSSIKEMSGSTSSVHDDKCSSSVTTKTSAASSTSSSLSRHGRWCEEEKMFPLKKRRLSLERFTTQECDKEDIFKMCATPAGSEINQVQINTIASAAKKRVTVINTASRLRNGLGWRCSNQRDKGSAWCDSNITHQSRTRDQKHASMPNASIYGKDSGVVKKRKRVRRISSILKTTPTMPFIANADK